MTQEPNPPFDNFVTGDLTINWTWRASGLTASPSLVSTPVQPCSPTCYPP